MDDYLFKKLEELENQNRGLVWEEVKEKPEIPNTTYID